MLVATTTEEEGGGERERVGIDETNQEFRQGTERGSEIRDGSGTQPGWVGMVDLLSSTFTDEGVMKREISFETSSEVETIWLMFPEVG